MKVGDIHMDKVNKPTWNVYRYDVNAQKMYVYNIFNHGGFWMYVQELFDTSKKKMTREYFDEKLKRELLYYFWSKSEHEIVVAPWIGKEEAAIKVDIYTQVMNNWEQFSDYVWRWYKENWDVK